MENPSGYLMVQIEDGEIATCAEWKHADIITRFIVLTRCFKALQIPLTVENLAMLKMSEEILSDIQKDE